MITYLKLTGRSVKCKEYRDEYFVCYVPNVLVYQITLIPFY